MRLTKLGEQRNRVVLLAYPGFVGKKRIGILGNVFKFKTKGCAIFLHSLLFLRFVCDGKVE